MSNEKSGGQHLWERANACTCRSTRTAYLDGSIDMALRIIALMDGESFPGLPEEDDDQGLCLRQSHLEREIRKLID